MITENSKKTKAQLEDTINAELKKITSLSKICKTVSVYNYCEGEDVIKIEDLEVVFDMMNKSSSLVADAVDRLSMVKKD